MSLSAWPQGQTFRYPPRCKDLNWALSSPIYACLSATALSLPPRVGEKLWGDRLAASHPFGVGIFHPWAATLGWKGQRGSVVELEADRTGVVASPSPQPCDRRSKGRNFWRRDGKRGCFFLQTEMFVPKTKCRSHLQNYIHRGT